MELPTSTHCITNDKREVDVNCHGKRQIVVPIRPESKPNEPTGSIRLGVRYRVKFPKCGHHGNHKACYNQKNALSK